MMQGAEGVVVAIVLVIAKLRIYDSFNFWPESYPFIVFHLLCIFPFCK